MTWLGVADSLEQRFSPYGLGIDRHDQPVIPTDAGAGVPQGTLLIETMLRGDPQPELLLDCDCHAAADLRRFRLLATPSGGVSFETTFGTNTRHALVQHGTAGRAELLRITYSWDAARNWARLAVERPGQTEAFSVEIADPMPMLVSDLNALIVTPAPTPEIRLFAAVTSEVVPLGPTPGLIPSAPVVTASGPRAATDLSRGDTVLTGPDGKSVPVLFAVRRRVPARGSFRPIRLRAPYFGLDTDLVVSPVQRLVLTGSDVEYTFGQDSVLVPAAHLVNGTAAELERCGPITEYVQLLMPSHDALHINGATLESLYIGRMRRKPNALADSILQDFPRQSLPEHARPSRPVLCSYEATALAQMRAA